MNIDNIDLRSNGLTVANLSFNDPGATNPYIMKNLYGLDADEITNTFLPGGANITNGLRLKSREVVMRIVLNPDFSAQTYSDLRDAIYKAIASNITGQVTIRFKEGLTTKAEVTGFVTKFEVPHSEPEPEIQITVFCEDGLLRDPVDTVLTSQYTGSYSTGQLFDVVDDDSTAPHGFYMAVKFNSTVSWFRIEGNGFNTGWSFQVDAQQWGGGSNFQVNDELHIHSVPGVRTCYAYNASGGNFFGMADRIRPYSIWPMLYPGETSFRFMSSGGSWNIHYLYHNKAYWGV